MTLEARLRGLDRRQQQNPRVAFVAAVVKKFSDDQAGQLAALIAYYGFVTMFPLLLVLVTVLGFVLQGDPDLQHQILDSALGQFPIVADQLKLHSLTGSGAGLTIGAVGSLVAGLGITGATQTAFDRIWCVPLRTRPNFLVARVRGLARLALLGTLFVLGTAAAGFVGTSSHSAPEVIAAVAFAFAVNVGLFMTAFKVLTAADVGWRELLPGVVFAAFCWQALQHLGGFYVDHELRRTGPLYSVFAVVLGLLAWLYLGAQLTMFAAEINVVRVHRLWPRTLFGDPQLDADHRALAEAAQAQQRTPGEDIDVTFEEP
jgi:membrane protein